MSATRCRARLRQVLVLGAVTAAALLAIAPVASAVESPPAAGSSQLCVPVSGGWLMRINGFGSSFPVNTTGTTTFTFANGDVVSLEATTTFEGIYHTATFTLDLRLPQYAALIGTSVHETADFEGATSSLDFDLVPCPTEPDSKDGCLKDVWQSYPALGFLNQGDCVAWIATEGKNEPGQNLPGLP
jgi:hypothetical protein